MLIAIRSILYTTSFSFQTSLLLFCYQDQYELIHQLVLEAKMFAHTEIGSADVRVKSAMLRETIPGSRKTKARVEFEVFVITITTQLNNRVEN